MAPATTLYLFRLLRYLHFKFSETRNFTPVSCSTWIISEMEAARGAKLKNLLISNNKTKLII